MSDNALGGPASSLPGAPPKFDLVGPTVDDDIRRVINRYGREAVKSAVKQLTKPRRGRPKINDWRELQSVMDTDAREWIEGGDPLDARTNYAIAKQFAEANPGQSAISTHQRIERKLARKPYDRRWYMLVTAETMTRDNYSWKQHIRALEGLLETDTHPVWANMLERATSDATDYQSKFGEPPADLLTMRQVEEGAREAMFPLSQLAKGGLAGLIDSHFLRQVNEG